jgi:hypothetical protein
MPITIVARTSGRVDDNIQKMNEFDTSYQFETDVGYHLEIVGRDELLKRGYALLQTKIVSPLEKSVKILLYKFSDQPDLELPFASGLWMVYRNSNYAHVKKRLRTIADDQNLSSTSSPSINYNHHQPYASTSNATTRGAIFD